jgi:hypothetical protein
MNIGLIIILLFYITPILICLIIGIVINWKDIETIGDLFFPFVEMGRDTNVPIYIPIANIIVTVVLIIVVCISFLTKVFCEWTSISEYISKFLNKKIK